MTFFNDKMAIVCDSSNNINLFRLVDRKINRYYFDKIQGTSEKVVANQVFSECNISIDKEDYIYLIYQDMSFDLILTLLKDEKIQNIKLTREPIPEVYYLDIILNNKEPHIFYYVLLSEEEKKYRIYHHYFNGVDWITNIVDETKVKQILNPLKVIKDDKKIIIGYYDKEEQIYIKSFDLEKRRWGKKIQLTNNNIPMLYIDLLLTNGKLNLVYCQHDGNMVVKYERFNYQYNLVQKEVEEVLSNEENPKLPTLIYYQNKLWVVWVEYENIMSRYSDDGIIWSPVYLWNDSKSNDIVKYKYCDVSNKDNNILNYSFGKIHPEINFIGFGTLVNATEIPIKKKPSFKIPKF